MSTLSLSFSNLQLYNYCSIDKLYQKMHPLFYLIPRHQEEGLKKLGCASFFHQLLGFWISDEILRVVFYIWHKVCVSPFRCQVTPVFDAFAIMGAATKISFVGTEPSKIIVNICYIKKSAKQWKYETKTQTNYDFQEDPSCQHAWTIRFG